MSLIFLWLLSWILIVIKKPQKVCYSLFRIYIDINQYIISWAYKFMYITRIKNIENISQQDIKYFLHILYKFHIRYTKSNKLAEGCKKCIVFIAFNIIKAWLQMKCHERSYLIFHDMSCCIKNSVMGKTFIL